MLISKKFMLASVWFCFFVATTHANIVTNTNNGQLFQFKFELNKPLIYSISFKTRVSSDLRAGQRSSLTRNSSDIRYKIRLTAVATNQDGTTAVYYEPFDYEQDIQFVGPSGQIDTTIRGLTVISKQDGVVTIDSENGIGISQLQRMKQAIYPHLLSGYFDFEPSGLIKKFEGDLPFIDTWQTTLKASTNLFYILFPTNALAVHDTWTNYYSLKTVGGFVLNGDGIVQPWSYVREADQTTTNGQVACFSLCESDIYKDMSGYINQMGQQTSVDFPEHTESMNANFQFNQKLGYLISMKKSDRSEEDIRTIVQGNPNEEHVESETDISAVLISP